MNKLYTCAPPVFETNRQPLGVAISDDLVQYGWAGTGNAPCQISGTEIASLTVNAGPGADNISLWQSGTSFVPSLTVAVDTTGKVTSIALRNPWGYDGYGNASDGEVTPAQLFAIIDYVGWGKV